MKLKTIQTLYKEGLLPLSRMEADFFEYDEKNDKGLVCMSLGFSNFDFFAEPCMAEKLKDEQFVTAHLVPYLKRRFIKEHSSAPQMYAGSFYSSEKWRQVQLLLSQISNELGYIKGLHSVLNTILNEFFNVNASRYNLSARLFMHLTKNTQYASLAAPTEARNRQNVFAILNLLFESQHNAEQFDLIVESYLCSDTRLSSIETAVSWSAAVESFYEDSKKTQDPIAKPKAKAFVSRILNSIYKKDPFDWIDLFKKIGFGFIDVDFPARAALSKVETFQILVSSNPRLNASEYMETLGFKLTWSDYLQVCKGLTIHEVANTHLQAEILSIPNTVSDDEFYHLATLVREGKIAKRFKGNDDCIEALIHKLLDALYLFSIFENKAQTSPQLELDVAVYYFNERVVPLAVKRTYSYFKKVTEYFGTQVGCTGLDYIVVKTIQRSASARTASIGTHHLSVHSMVTQFKLNKNLEKSYFVNVYINTNVLDNARVNKLPWFQKQVYYKVMYEGFMESAYSTLEDLAAHAENALEFASTFKGSYDAREFISTDMLMAEFVYNRQKHTRAFKPVPNLKGIPGLDDVNPHEKGIAWSAYEKLCEWAGVNPYAKTGYGQEQNAAFNMVKLFGSDIESIKRFISKAITRKNIKPKNMLHDIGLRKVPEEANWSKQKWAAFLLAYPTAFEYVQFMPKYESKYGIPANKQEFMSKVACFAYENVSEGQEEFAQYCFDLGLEDGEYQEVEHIKMKLTPKKNSIIPSHSVSQDGYELHLLKPGDYRALLIGIETDCCQHINEGYAQDCAEHSYESQASGVYVIDRLGEHKTKEDRCAIAQSFVWITEDRKGIVIDSIESSRSDHKSIGLVTEMYLKLFAKISIEHEMDIYLSATNYGMTSDVTKAIRQIAQKENIDGTAIRHNNENDAPNMLEYCDYTDTDGGCYKVTEIFRSIELNRLAKVAKIEKQLEMTA